MKNTLITLALITTLLFSGCHHNKQNEEIVQDGFYDLKYDIWYGDWYKERDKIAQEFQEERNRLGPNFGRELYELTNDEYTKNDLDMYYWLATFLTEEYYLYDNKPDHNTAIKLLERGLTFVDRTDINDQYQEFTMLVSLAVLHAENGNTEEAKRIKQQAEARLEENEDLIGGFPVMYEEERKLYESL